MFNFRPKIAKSQEPDKTPYTIFSLVASTTPLSQRKWSEAYIQFISIDPVKKNLGNFAIRVERRFSNGLIVPLLFTKIDMKDFENNDVDVDTNTELNSNTGNTKEIKGSGKEEILELIDLTGNDVSSKSTKKKTAKKTKKSTSKIEEAKLEVKKVEVKPQVKVVKRKKDLFQPDAFSSMYHQITQFLDQYISLYKESHIVIIERQLPFNYRAVRISQHVISYFINILRDSPLHPVVLEIDPKLKTKELGAPKGLNDKQVKSWCVEKGEQLLDMRGDIESLKILEKYKNLKKAKKSEKKLDDLLDTVCQIEALCHYLEYPITKAAIPIQF